MSAAAVATLTRLRHSTFPQIATPASFAPRAGTLAPQPRWLAQLIDQLSRRAMFAAAVAAIVVIVATAIPAWGALRPSSTASPLSGVRSSAGVTGTNSTRVAGLGVTTFVGEVPFVQQLRYLNAAAGAAPRSQRFVVGARQASVAAYLQNVGVQATLPYLDGAATTKGTIDTWTAAVAQVEVDRQAVLAAQAYAAAPVRAVWQAPLLAPGTTLASTVTFYSCINNGFCGHMANGQLVFDGAAACSINMPFGTKFYVNADPAQRIFTCLDRGALAPTWVDIWFYDAADGWAWQAIVGTRSDITIVE